MAAEGTTGDGTGETAGAPVAVSVVVPCRNEAAFIEPCVEALLVQEGLPERYEVLVVDGMSDDGTREVLERLAAANPRLLILDNPGRIVSSALNVGIEAARGEVFIRVDAHTRVAPDFVRRNLELLAEHPEAWCVGGPIVHRGRTPFGRAAALAMSSRLGVGGASHRREDTEGYAEGAVFPAIRRWVFERIGGFDEELVRNQDDEFNFRVHQAGGRIYISPRVRHEYYVRDRPAQLFRQYAQYGYWKVRVMLKHRRPIALRHLVPIAFVVGLPASLVVAALLPVPWSLAAAAPVAAYALAIAAFAVRCAASSRSPVVGWWSAVAVAILHLAYGWGSLRGWWRALRGKQWRDPAMEELSR